MEQRIMDHSPLSQDQIDFLARTQIQPFEATIEEAMGYAVGINFLTDAGYLTPVQLHVDQNPGKNRFRWTRTAKPLP
jgi:hypothetical protein